MLKHKVGNKVSFINKNTKQIKNGTVSVLDNNSHLWVKPNNGEVTKRINIKNIQKKKIIINFDINKTIIYFDACSKESTEDLIKYNLSFVIFYNKLLGTYHLGENLDKISDNYVSYNSIKQDNKKEIINNIISEAGKDFITYYINYIKTILDNKQKTGNLLLDSFLKFIIYIKNIKTYDVKVLFRTFGVDGLPLILKYFPECKDFGRLIRFDDGIIMRYLDVNKFNETNKKTANKIQTIEKQKLRSNLQEFSDKKFGKNENSIKNGKNGQKQHEKVEIIKDYEPIIDKINSVFNDKDYMFIRDDYFYWSRNEGNKSRYQRGPYAKVIFPIENAIQLFFDDGIYEDKNNYGIVSIRNNKFVNVKFKKDVFIFNASIMSVIDDNYYIDKFLESFRYIEKGNSSVTQRLGKVEIKTYSPPLESITNF